MAGNGAEMGGQLIESAGQLMESPAESVCGSAGQARARVLQTHPAWITIPCACAANPPRLAHEATRVVGWMMRLLRAEVQDEKTQNKLDSS